MSDDHGAADAILNSRVSALEERVNSIDARLNEVEKSEPLQAQATDWVYRGIWAAVTAAAMYVAARMGVL